MSVERLLKSQDSEDDFLPMCTLVEPEHCVCVGGFQVMASVQFRCRMTSQLESNGNGQFSTVMSMKL